MSTRHRITFDPVDRAVCDQDGRCHYQDANGELAWTRDPENLVASRGPVVWLHRMLDVVEPPQRKRWLCDANVRFTPMGQPYARVEFMWSERGFSGRPCETEAEAKADLLPLMRFAEQYADFRDADIVWMER